MAIYTYNQKRTREIQKAINKAPPGYKVYFQPTHHGGCIQVLKIKTGSETVEYCINIFKSHVSGYKTFCQRLGILQQDTLRLKRKWIDFILAAKELKFEVIHKRDKVSITLKWIAK